jgi:hypothetical protein
MCKNRPCWGTPEQIEKIIDAGHADKLMGDYWAGELNGYNNPTIVSPAIKGYGGKSAPFWPHGRCVFLTKSNKCKLHGTSMKPLEGALASCDGGHQNSQYNVHKMIAETWATEKGQEVANKWWKL